jgi:hypothetical protein
MAPAHAGIFGYEHDTSESSSTRTRRHPGDYNQRDQHPGRRHRQQLDRSNVEPNGFACSIQGDYGVTDQLIDSIVPRQLGRPLPRHLADGNERLGSRCDVEGFGDFFSTAPRPRRKTTSPWAP